MNQPFTTYQKILLCLIMSLPAVTLVDIALQYFFDIHLLYFIFVLPWAILVLSGLYVFFSRKKIFAFVLLGVVLLCGSAYYNFTRQMQVRSRSSIPGSQYAIAIAARSYSVIRDYGFAEKTIAIKASSIFFDPDSKTGVNQAYRVGVMKETPDSLYLEINSGRTRKVDSLRKRSLWERK